MNTPMDLALWVIAGLGLLGGFGSGIKALLDYRNNRAKANLDDTSATAAVSAAARELVDPLRQQLAVVRKENARDRAADRREIRAVRTTLAECRAEAEELRGELALARVEADELRRDREEYREKLRQADEKDRLNQARIRDLERQLADRP